jgi:hypothetical protein
MCCISLRIGAAAESSACNRQAGTSESQENKWDVFSSVVVFNIACVERNQRALEIT